MAARSYHDEKVGNMMKVLMVNKFLYPKGGSETYIFSLGKLLEEHGHEVQFFGLKDERNTVGNRVNSLVDSMEFADGIKKNLKAPFRIIYNGKARKDIRLVLDDFQPDVVHINNIEFHLTPSILLEIDKWRKESEKKCRIVNTTHDYQLVCPNHTMIGADQKPCEKCLDGHYTHCIQTKCLKNSTLKSALGAADAFYWKHKNVYRLVDTFICCSRFLKEKLDTQPQYRGKTVVLHNFDFVPRLNGIEKKNYILYFGRMDAIKGVDTLIEAAKRMPEKKFVFAGEGPSAEKTKSTPNIRYVGFQSGEVLYRLIAEAKLTVCPSEWYENCPFSVIEAISLGTPVAGARIGGIPELITEGKTGELFEAGDVDDMVRTIEKISDASEKYSASCSDADFETAESYYNQLMKIYGA